MKSDLNRAHAATRILCCSQLAAERLPTHGYRLMQSPAPLDILFAALIFVFIGLVIYVSRNRLPCSLCNDAGCSWDGIACPFCSER